MPPRRRKVTNDDEADDIKTLKGTRRRSFSDVLARDVDDIVHSIEHLGDDLVEAIVGTGGEDVYEKIYICPTEKFMFICTGIQPIGKMFKAKTKGTLNTIVALIAVIHFIYVWYKVLYFLKWYYIDAFSPTLKVLSVEQRFGIASSYLIIDLIYPIAAFILLNMLNGKLLIKVDNDLLDDCGEHEHEKVKRIVERRYHGHLFYFTIHVIVLFVWLYSNGYPFFDVVFWSIIFGVPHALNPILLTVVITRIFEYCSARIESFRSKFNSGYYKNADSLWNSFIKLRNEIEQYGEKLQFPLGFFLVSLLLAIVFQGLAVFVFKGEMFSLVYMSLNVYCLLNVIYKAVHVIKSFQECCDDIIHSPTDSSLGPINSTARQNVHHLLSREDFFPAFRAWEFDLTSTQLTQAFTVSVAAIFSVLWETFNVRELFLPTQKDSSDNNENMKEFMSGMMKVFTEEMSRSMANQNNNINNINSEL